jgi:hypothetical protein
LDETINLAKILGIIMVLTSVILLVLLDREKTDEVILQTSNLDPASTDKK